MGKKEIKFMICVTTALLLSGYFFLDLKNNYPVSSGSVISLVLFALPALYYLTVWSGFKKSLIVLLGLSAFAFIIETIGVKTGFPYGQFQYSGSMGKLLLNAVPWTLPLAWVPLVLASVVVAKLRFTRFWPTIAISTLLLLIADLVLDPGAAAAGLWAWHDKGIYYGIPFSNYIGWLISGSLGSALAYWLLYRNNPQSVIPVRIGYSGLFTIIFWIGVVLKEGMALPAIAGFVWVGLIVAALHYYGKLSDEYVVLIDDNNRVLGTAPKLDTHNQNTPLHRAFSIFIFDSQGQVLLQQRAWNKKTWPGVWSNSCCGHLWLHESAVTAAQRRTQYELGINLKKIIPILPDYRYRVERHGVVENEICPVLVAETDQQPDANRSEVSAVAWIKWDKFMETVHANPAHYSPWCVEEARLLSNNRQFIDWLKSSF